MDELETHLRKEHEKYFCDLCRDNLKAFSHERKYYTRSELARHRKKGDPDETCHRGHPLCKFCDLRYMDEEELQSHLRREHFYCHICDPTGLKTDDYFDDYDHLRDHFRRQHFLCEEGDCKEERFVHAFKTEIDLTAHRASVHCQNVSKAEARQARTLSLNLFMRPRTGQTTATVIHHQRKHNRRGVPEEPVEDFNDDSEPVQPAGPPKMEDFPTLGGTVPENDNVTNRFNVHYGQGGKADIKSEDEFPSLSSDHLGNPLLSAVRNPKAKVKQETLSSKLRKNNIPNGGLVPTTQQTKKNKAKKPVIDDTEDFPALPSSKKEFVTVPLGRKKTVFNLSAKTAAKSTESKIKLSQNGNVLYNDLQEMTKPTQTSKAQLSSLNDFPALEPSLRGPPPGISKKLPQSKKGKPPPGWGPKNVSHTSEISLSSVAQEVIGSSKNENFAEEKAIESTYTNPTNFDERNRKLVALISDVLKDNEKFNSFQNYSREFRQDSITTSDYYRKCLELFGSNLKSIFSELLVLLPDIRKQNQLLLEYEKSSKGAIPKKSAWNAKTSEFAVCSSCRQVLAQQDTIEHMSIH